MAGYLRCFIMVCLFTLATASHAREFKELAETRTAPDFTLRDMDGREHRLSQYRGKGVLLNFWATWCPPCVEELPSLQRLQEHSKTKNFVVLTVDVGEPAELIKPFLDKVSANNLIVLLDLEGKAHKEWNVYVFPTTFLIDTEGKIRYGAAGALAWDAPDIIRIIERVSMP